MQRQVKCSKCDGAMIEGFVLDGGRYSAKLKQIWVEGQPEESLWSGLKTSGKETFNVQAFRCSDCNYLEFYTTDRIYL